MKGWVYVISNQAMPGVVKVGYSTKDPELRASELNNTGAPHPYVVEYEALVEQPRYIEQRVHRRLFEHREGREWFRCTPEFAVSVIQEVIGSGTITESFKRADRARAEALRRERDEQKVRRERIEAKYKEQLRLAFPERPTVGYMFGVFLLALAGLSMATPKFSEGQVFFWSLVIGVIGGFLAKNWHQAHRRSSRSYQAILKQRDEELASIGSIVLPCPQCKQSLRVPRDRSLRVICPRCQHTFSYTT